jgi:TPR repeat protein
VKQDYSEAAKCFRKAAERGHAEAQFNLGKSYYNGHGTNNIIPRPLSVTKIGK